MAMITFAGITIDAVIDWILRMSSAEAPAPAVGDAGAVLGGGRKGER